MTRRSPIIDSAQRVGLSLILATLSFTVAFADPCDRPVMAPGEVIWEGAPDALDLLHSRPIVELAPDGKSFLFLQGLPWPRLMIQSVEPGEDEPVMLGTKAPFGGRQPRFSPDGQFVYFTAELDWRPRRRPRKGDASPGDDVRTAAIRIALKDHAETTIAPAPGSSRDAFGIFLDLDPTGERALVGTGNGLRAYGFLMAPYEMEVFEVDLSNRQPWTKLPFVLKEAALARYSADGQFIYYSNYAKDEGLAVVYGYQRATGARSKLHRDVLRIGWRAGDLDVAAVPSAHLGSFGFDGFRSFLFRLGHDDPVVHWRPSADFLGDRVDGAPWPRAVRGARVLLRLGLPDRPRFAVCQWDRTAYRSRLKEAIDGPECLGDRRLPAARARIARARSESLRLARVAPVATELVDRLERSLILLPSAPVASVRVRWKEARSEAGVQRDFEVIERATGEMIIEKVTPPFDELDAPMKELSVSDGRIFRHTDDRGDTRDVPEHLFEQERLGVSPYHLLLDPAGLTHADLEYVSVDGGDKQKRLGFRYLDGYSGHLLVEIDGPSVRPVEIVSRMSFPSDRVRESLGNPRGETDSQYKSVRFVDYRPLDGRLVPHTVIFTNRLLDYTLTLESLELNPEVPDDTFDCE